MAEKAGVIESFKRIPKHIGIIPDGNRRWAVNHKMEKHEGYSCGVEPGVKLCEQLLAYGVEEVTFYDLPKTIPIDQQSRRKPILRLVSRL